MSKQAKVSASPFKQAGRFTTDDAARERVKVMRVSPQHDVVAHVPHTPAPDPITPEPATAGEPVPKGGPITATARRKAAGSRR